jgi:uncharacterized iron-regulated protein
MRAADVVLLGEVHDHPGLHAQRAALLDRYLDRAAPGRPVLLALEHFDLRDDARLRAAWQSAPDAPSQWIVAAAPTARFGGGWDWTVIAPALQVAARYRVPVYAANRTAGELLADTTSTLPPLAPEAHARLMRLLDDGHCGLLPAETIAPMARMQRLRDLAMADVALTARAAGAVPVLLAGNGHVRRDLGVPAVLAARATQARPDAAPPNVLVIGFVERNHADDASAYDLLLRLPPHPRPDPCVALRERMKSSGAPRTPHRTLESTQP